MINIIEILKCNEDDEIVLHGWVERHRDMGYLKFLLLFDREARIQVVLSQEKVTEVLCEGKRLSYDDIGSNIKINSIIYVTGKLKKRVDKGVKDEGNVHLNFFYDIKRFELVASKIEIMSEGLLNSIDFSSEQTKLLFRIDYLRTNRMKFNLKMKNDFLFYCRNFLFQRSFMELHTPVLSRDTVEGARMFEAKGHLKKYFLSQSPQIYKQCLMSASYERYFQVASCFRDEDLRNDRQPEFLQLDIEMSFSNHKDVMKLIEDMITYSLSAMKMSSPVFETITYKEAMNTFYCDKPDLRSGVSKPEMLNDVLYFSFDNVVTNDVLNNLLEVMSDIEGNIFHKGKFLFENPSKEMIEISKNRKTNVFFSNNSDAAIKMSIVRKTCLDTISPNEKRFVWITDIPMFENVDGKIKCLHNPFTSPNNDQEFLSSNNNSNELVNIISNSFDLVLNGSEVVGGSQRIRKWNIQKKVFDILDMTKEDIETFAYFMKTMKVGLPPHAGAAMGIDRFLREMLGGESIREFIAFPKSSSGSCIFTEQPL